MEEIQLDEDGRRPLTITVTQPLAQPTVTYANAAPSQSDKQLFDEYTAIVDKQRLSWTTYHRLTKLLGSGGQGKVYLSQRKGADGFTLPIAIKIFATLVFQFSSRISLAVVSLQTQSTKANAIKVKQSIINNKQTGENNG